MTSLLPIHQTPGVHFVTQTDGSLTAGTVTGSTGMVVTDGNFANPTILLTKTQSGAAITSSCDKEKASVSMPLQLALLTREDTTLLWIPRLHGITGNLQADTCAM